MGTEARPKEVTALAQRGPTFPNGRPDGQADILSEPSNMSQGVPQGRDPMVTLLRWWCDLCLAFRCHRLLSDVSLSIKLVTIFGLNEITKHPGLRMY